MKNHGIRVDGSQSRYRVPTDPGGVAVLSRDRIVAENDIVKNVAAGS
jgi:hypothetical protein